MKGKHELVQNFTVMSNNERRVKKTAEEFAMGFMGEDELPKLEIKL